METTEQFEINPKKLALTNALIWAAINIALFLLVYYAKPDLMGSFAFAGISIAIGLGLAVYFCIDIRQKIGGYWSFKEALGSIFILFFTQALIVLFFTLIFGKFIEPSYPAKIKEIASASTQKMMEKMGMDQDKIDEAMKETEIKFEKQFNPGVKDVLKTIATSAIMYFVGALIFAAIFKKDRPMFESVSGEE
jgi:Protein of unknown function (DUF4199)